MHGIAIACIWMQCGSILGHIWVTWSEHNGSPGHSQVNKCDPLGALVIT